MEVPDSASLGLSSAFTLAAWVEPASLSGGNGYYVVIDKTDSTSPTNYYIAFYKNEIDSGFYNTSGCTNNWCEHKTSSVGATINTWIHIAVTYDDATDAYKLYANGTEKLSETETNQIVQNNKPLLIGASAPSAEHFNGVIDEVMIYNRALSPQEILDIYNSTK